MAKIVMLQTEKDFSHTRFKKSFSSPSFRIRFAPTSQNHPRFGFIIPKKVLPKVTDRNKIKRRLKTIVIRILPHLHQADILIFPQKASLNQTFAVLQEELVRNFKKLNLWKS